MLAGWLRDGGFSQPAPRYDARHRVDHGATVSTVSQYLQLMRPPIIHDEIAKRLAILAKKW